MKKATILFFLSIFFHSAFSFENSNDKIHQIKTLSQKLVEALKSESLESTLSLFCDEATLLPEYHKSLVGKSKIRAYYSQFFEKTVTSKLSKKSFEILDLGMYFVELGTFEHTYKTPKNEEFHYKGKYTTYWLFSEDKAPKIIAHILGASNYFEAENLNFISVAVSDSKEIIPSSQWERDIEEIRKFVYDAILSGDSKRQMKTYAEDAVYMTYYVPPFIGKGKIREYFDQHYNPDVSMDSLMTKSVRVIDMGDYALKFGEYYVGWTWEGKPSYIEGKGLTLYKRMEDDSIKIYRQMINHSMPATPKE
ncbi:YybH family protein [Croceitalea marina]|uniref:YybH family protein n=1 Tax=Croceitalea marina TaxID=1775166 RepID=A0ABW5MVI9_9FLAO